jgi:hypothetical protein
MADYNEHYIANITPERSSLVIVVGKMLPEAYKDIQIE